MSTFEAFLLRATERAPFLLGDFVKASLEQQQKRKRGRNENKTADGGNDDRKKQPMREEDFARLQRLLVDGPLQPLGAEHALYHILIPAFIALMDAAREVWRTTRALRAAENMKKEEEAQKMIKDTEKSNCTDPAPTVVLDESEGSLQQQQQPGVEALRRAVASAQTKLNLQRRGLDVAQTRVRTLVEALGRHNALVLERRQDADE